MSSWLELIKQSEPAELRQSDIRLVNLSPDWAVALRTQIYLLQGQVSFFEDSIFRIDPFFLHQVLELASPLCIVL